jgi:hypothetical protein
VSVEIKAISPGSRATLETSDLAALENLSAR